MYLTFNASYSANSDVLVPQLPLCEAHYILFCNLSYYSLNLLRAHTAASGDDLASNVFRYGGGTIEG
jgi:hypothetical protein